MHIRESLAKHTLMMKCIILACGWNSLLFEVGILYRRFPQWKCFECDFRLRFSKPIMQAGICGQPLITALYCLSGKSFLIFECRAIMLFRDFYFWHRLISVMTHSLGHWSTWWSFKTINWIQWWIVVKSVGIHGSLSLLFVMKKVMVWHFVSNSLIRLWVMTALIVMLPLKFFWWKFLCNLIDVCWTGINILGRWWLWELLTLLSVWALSKASLLMAFLAIQVLLLPQSVVAHP